MQDKKPDLSFFHVFGALCYPTNDNDDLGKLDAKADIGIFVGYAPAKKAFRIYNKRTQEIIETIHVTFNELTAMASKQFSSGPRLHSMTPATSSSGLVPNIVSQQPCIPLNRDDWDHLFQPMFDEYFNPPSIDLNFGTLNKLAKDGLARGIPRLKFQKDHLCSACALGKSKKSSHQPKAKDTNQEKLYLLHMDLCGPMRVASINGKRYILVIVDDYSRFNWVRFLRTKDEAPEAIIKCIKNIQVRLNENVCNVRTNNGTEFVNQTLREFYENVGISHQTSVARTPQQNNIVERRNQTLDR
ncbi:retrovirus-related pol polyprotein from transposon TNT 1-94 [Tanacetum coccineum]